MTTVADWAPEELRRLDAFHNLLPTLSQALDVREVFTQVSAIAAQVIPHDEANLALFVPNDGLNNFTEQPNESRCACSSARIPARSRS